jgi:hypothetical protein
LFGSLPSMLGAGPLRHTVYVGIRVTTFFLSSIDHPPFVAGVAPDGLSESREKSIAMPKAYQEAFHEPPEIFLQAVEDLEGKKTDLFYTDAMVHIPNCFIQMCLPSLEYPRSGAPQPSSSQAASLPATRDPATSHPPWWDEVTTNPSQKRIIAVTQGTVRPTLSELIIPTMHALQSLPEILTIAVLGKNEAVLPQGTFVPAKTRIADYIPFDELLPHASVLVVNGGYSGFQHAVSHWRAACCGWWNGGETGDGGEGEVGWCGC